MCDYAYFFSVRVGSAGSVGLGFVRCGLVWFDLVEFCVARFDLVRFGSVRFGSVRFGSAHFGSVGLGSVWCGFRLGLILATVGCGLFGLFRSRFNSFSFLRRDNISRLDWLVGVLMCWLVGWLVG